MRSRIYHKLMMMMSYKSSREDSRRHVMVEKQREAIIIRKRDITAIEKQGWVSLRKVKNVSMNFMAICWSNSLPFWRSFYQQKHYADSCQAIGPWSFTIY
ncbi:hypothetical protein Peur_074035 [Populus x canadensis]